MKMSKTIIYLLAFGYSWVNEEVSRLPFQHWLLLNDVTLTFQLMVQSSESLATSAVTARSHVYQSFRWMVMKLIVIDSFLYPFNLSYYRHIDHVKDGASLFKTPKPIVLKLTLFIFKLHKLCVLVCLSVLIYYFIDSTKGVISATDLYADNWFFKCIIFTTHNIVFLLINSSLVLLQSY